MLTTIIIIILPVKRGEEDNFRAIYARIYVLVYKYLNMHILMIIITIIINS
jgi:hypothetical protein